MNVQTSHHRRPRRERRDAITHAVQALCARALEAWRSRSWWPGAGGYRSWQRGSVLAHTRRPSTSSHSQSIVMHVSSRSNGASHSSHVSMLATMHSPTWANSAPHSGWNSWNATACWHENTEWGPSRPQASLRKGNTSSQKGDPSSGPVGTAGGVHARAQRRISSCRAARPTTPGTCRRRAPGRASASPRGSRSRPG